MAAKLLSALLAICLIASSALATEREPTVVVRATLKEQSPLPSPADIFVYQEGLVTYRYQIDEVVSGRLREQEILVTHWGVQRGIVQPISNQEIGHSVTLKLAPFADFREEKLDEVFRTDLSHPHLPVFHDVGQEIIQPVQGRWNYSVDVTRNMRAFHALKNQLKLVTIGDCQSWFSNLPALHYIDENAQTPVALSLAQERSDLSFYATLTEHYLSKMPKLEWVVVGWHTRWVNGRASWRGQKEKTRDFIKSTGFNYDHEHADSVWAPASDGKPITVEQLKQDSELWNSWEAHPYGAVMGITANERKQAAAKREAGRAKANYAFSEKRWQQWRSIVEDLTAANVKVLIYTLPIHPATGKQDVKDKMGTTADGYAQQVKLMRELEEEFADQVFFLDLNQAGNHDIDGQHFTNVDHLTTSGAEIATGKVEAFRLEVEKRLAPAKTKTTVAEQPAPTTSPEANVADRYQGLLKERLLVHANNGKRIRFHMAHLFRGQEVQVEEVDDGGARVSTGSMATKLALWKVLPDSDRAALSQALAKGSNEPADAALAAYYSFAAGDDRQATLHLPQAGEYREEIQAAFKR